MKNQYYNNRYQAFWQCKWLNKLDKVIFMSHLLNAVKSDKPTQEEVLRYLLHSDSDKDATEFFLERYGDTINLEEKYSRWYPKYGLESLPTTQKLFVKVLIGIPSLCGTLIRDLINNLKQDEDNPRILRMLDWAIKSMVILYENNHIRFDFTNIDAPLSFWTKHIRIAAALCRMSDMNITICDNLKPYIYEYMKQFNQPF